DGDDTLTGGKGEDTFVYKRYDGNDVITDYKPGEDKIEISEGEITDIKYKNDDVIFTIGRNTLTVKNNNGNEITITDENGDTTTETYIDNKKEAVLPLGAKYNSSKTTLTLSKKFKDDEIDLSDYADTVKTITATAVKNELTITANENNNKIKVGKKATTVYGGAGNDQITGGAGADALYGEDDDDKPVGGSGADTLSGGEGDDTLTGGAGKDVFVYDGNGADVITDYKAGQDVIQISDEVEFESVTVKGKNVTFNLGSDKLTIKNAKNKKITFVDEDGEVISEDKYKKSATFDTDDDDDDERDFVEASDYWFAKDDNFEMNNIEMTINNETTYSIGKIETSDVLTNLDSSLTNKNEQILTASSK
ncbi:MAG: calcium-binding protein, partial [Selenomonadaceae bacterium]|nr:calcium-binding protein [Selenomonadaceae bacterium]